MDSGGKKQENDAGNAAVDGELVLKLVASGTDDAIAAEQVDKTLQRRNRHRMNMLRYRRKKKVTLGEMKHQEQFLEAQLQSMLRFHASQSPSYQYHLEDESPLHQHGMTQQQGRQQPTPMDAFVDVLAQKEHLHHENLVLRQQLDEFHKFHEAVMQQIRELKAEDSKQKKEQMHCKTAHSDPNQGYWVSFLENETPFFFVPFTEAECRVIANNTLRNVFALQTYIVTEGQTKSKTNLIRVGTFFQWQVSIIFEWDDVLQVKMVRFKFRKTFRNPPCTIAELVDRDWEVMHTPKLYQNLHSVPVDSRVLQTWNGNLSVTMRNKPDPTQTSKYRSLSVYARSPYRNPQGKECQIVTITAVKFKSVEGSEPESEQVVEPGCGDRTLDGEEVVYSNRECIYMTFMEGQGEDEVDLEYGGRVEVMNEEFGRFLMVELVGSLVRFEQLLIPFRVLTSSDD